MADSAVVHIGENSPQQVAYKLMQDVMLAEKMSTTAEGTGQTKRADRAYLLKLYWECQKAVRGFEP